MINLILSIQGWKLVLIKRCGFDARGDQKAKKGGWKRTVDVGIIL